MTAVMERPVDVSESRQHADTLEELRALLVAQERTLAEQYRMLAALDERREQFDELVADMMPVANAAMLMATRQLESATAPEVQARVRAAMAQVGAVRGAPAPGLFALLRRLRDPQVRMGLALALAVLGAAGGAATAAPGAGSAETPTT